MFKMKKLLFVIIGFFLGIGGTSLYLWMQPVSEDPYSFLSPKIAEGHPLNIPIELYKKGASIDYVFWITPIPRQKYFYFFPANLPSTYIELKIENNKNNQYNFYLNDIFTNEGLIELQDKTPMLLMELYKINSNQTESRVKQKIHLYDRVSANRTFMLLSVPKEYGQYRLKITVLGDWPQLQKEGLEYFIKINTQPNK